jgi:hypothetical protein
MRAKHLLSELKLRPPKKPPRRRWTHVVAKATTYKHQRPVGDERSRPAAHTAACGRGGPVPAYSCHLLETSGSEPLLENCARLTI